MRTPLASLCSGQINGLPEEGPLCYHNEPTVLKVLNGRYVYCGGVGTLIRDVGRVVDAPN